MPFDKVHARVNLGFYNKSGILTHSAGSPTLKMQITIATCVECNEWKHDLYGNTFTVATRMKE